MSGTLQADRRKGRRRLRLPFLFWLALWGGLPLLCPSALSSPGQRPAPSLEELLRQGEELAKEKRFLQAIALFERARVLSPTDPRPFFFAGLVLAEMGRLREAVAELEQARQRDPADQGILLAYAQLLERMGQGREALGELEELASQQPLSSDLNWFLADLYYREEKFEQALQVLERYRRQVPQDGRVPLRQGQIYLMAGQLEAAEEAFREVIRNSPQLGAGYYGLGLVLWRSDRAEEAVQYLQEAVRREPHNFEYLYQLGVVYLSLEKPQEALPYLERAEAQGDLPALYLVLSRTYRRLQRLEEAEAYLQRFQQAEREQRARREKQQRVSRQLRAGQEALQAGEVAEARRLFLELLQEDPDNWAAHSFLAKIALSSRRWKEAFTHLSRMQELDPDSFEGNYLWAYYWYEQGDQARALESAQLALALRPGYGELRNLLGNIYLALGLREKALQEYQAAVTLEPERSDFRLNLETLRRRPP